MGRQKLKINLIEIKAVKFADKIKVPQKTLRKLENIIINSKITRTVNFNQKINDSIIVIDDVMELGGVTLNKTAGKIRNITNKKQNHHQIDNFLYKNMKK